MLIDKNVTAEPIHDAIIHSSKNLDTIFSWFLRKYILTKVKLKKVITSSSIQNVLATTSMSRNEKGIIFPYYYLNLSIWKFWATRGNNVNIARLKYFLFHFSYETEKLDLPRRLTWTQTIFDKRLQMFILLRNTLAYCKSWQAHQLFFFYMINFI